MELIQIVTMINALVTMNEQVTKIIQDSKEMTPDQKAKLLNNISTGQNLPRKL